MIFKLLQVLNNNSIQSKNIINIIISLHLPNIFKIKFLRITLNSTLHLEQNTANSLFNSSKSLLVGITEFGEITLDCSESEK